MRHSNDNTRPIPICSLKGFDRIHLKKGESRIVSFILTPEELALTNSDGTTVQSEGSMDIYIGGGQPYKSEGVFYSLDIKGESYQVF